MPPLRMEPQFFRGKKIFVCGHPTDATQYRPLSPLSQESGFLYNLEINIPFSKLPGNFNKKKTFTRDLKYILKFDYDQLSSNAFTAVPLLLIHCHKAHIYFAFIVFWRGHFQAYIDIVTEYRRSKGDYVIKFSDAYNILF